MRMGLGPVFAYEWLRTSRNWRMYAMRGLFGLGLLAVLAMTALSVAETYQYRQLSEIQAQAQAGQAFSSAIVMTGLSLILLVAPATTAGTLCLDKQRGTLAHVLVTDLSGGEVVLGKLVARLIPVLGLVLNALGIMAVCTLMGGIDPVGLTGAMLVMIGSGVLAASLALCLSVWASRTHEVVMTTYLVLGAWLLFYPVWYALSHMGAGISRPPTWLELAHPYWIIADVRPGAVPLHHHALFCLACLVLSACLAALATARIRAVAIRQMNRPVKPKRRWRKAERPVEAGIHKNAPAQRRWRFRLWPGPSLDGNPVLWREWHRAQPSRWLRVIWWSYALGSIVATAFGVYLMTVVGGRGSGEGAMVMINGLQIGLGLLLLSVSAAASLAEERVRGSLDVLLATPLSTWSVVWGKWRGTFRTVPSLAIAPGVLAAVGVFLYDPNVGPAVPVKYAAPILAPNGVPMFLRNPPLWAGIPLLMAMTLAYGAAITSFGLAMATWISRLDRAVAATVSFYVFMTVGWLFLIVMLMKGDNVAGPGMASASPFFGPAFTSAMLVETRSSMQLHRWPGQFAWAAFWVAAYSSFAAGLLRLTAMSFNRKLGRMPEEGMAAPPIPAVPPLKKELEPVLIGE